MVAPAMMLATSGRDKAHRRAGRHRAAGRFLPSPHASAITGQTIAVDGGASRSIVY
jgi:enoyl-[acyl-carrier-protein] reductase (NADH)